MQIYEVKVSFYCTILSHVRCTRWLWSETLLKVSPCYLWRICQLILNWLLLHFNVQGSNNMKRSYEGDDGTDVLDSRAEPTLSETD